MNLRITPSFAACARRAAFAVIVGACSPAWAWLPGTSAPNAVEGFSVDRTNRRDVLAYYHTVYTASEGYASRINWTGSLVTGAPGTTSAEFKNDVRRRINFYRALVGQPGDIVFSAVKSAKCQEDALLSARNGALNHSPPSSWIFYTANAAEAAGNSNLTLGFYGPGAIDAYVREDGTNNALVGHRRWLFYSRAREMGTGDLPPVGSYYSSNTTWVIGDTKPAPAGAFTAWPGAGYFPLPLMCPRWSLSYPGANFANATVTLARNGTAVAVTIISRTDNGYGDNTLVWEPATLPATIAADTPYTVTVSGITGAGVPSSHTYSITVFDPAVLGDTLILAGSDTPPVTGAPYTFNTIAQADQYELNVSTATTSPWTEGAEAAPAPKVLDQTSPEFPLLQSAVKRTGARAFQLTFPNFDRAAQIVEVDREILPSASSSLVFYDLFHYVTTASRLSAEVSENGGASWTEVWGRNGNGSGSSANWDATFNVRSVSLASRAGKTLRVRFVFRHNNSAFIGTASSHGIFLDDISVTAASELINPTITLLPAAASGWTLNSATAGAALQVGLNYHLRMRPFVGQKWFPFGTTRVVTPRAATGYETWAATRSPALTGGATDDPDGDGIPSGFEYAFATNPMVSTSRALLPLPNFAPAGYGTSFATPAGVTGVFYGAEWSPDLVSWTAIPDAGSGFNHLFRIPTAGTTRRFFRLTVSLTP